MKEKRTKLSINNYLTFKDNKENEKIQGVYGIEVNNKIVYIGQSTDISTRCKQHTYKIIKPLEKCKKYNSDLIPVYVKLKELFYDDYFIRFVILERIEDKNKLKEKEKYYINKYNPSLNTHN